MDCSGMADVSFLTCCYGRRSRTANIPRYDLQSAALVIITLKMLFGMDDATEW